MRCLEEERERERKEGRKERKERRKEERKEGRKEERKEEKKGEERFNRGKLSFIFDRPPFSSRIEIYYRARSTRVPLLPQLFVSISTHCTTRIHNSLLEKKKGEREKERGKKDDRWTIGWTISSRRGVLRPRTREALTGPATGGRVRTAHTDAHRTQRRGRGTGQHLFNGAHVRSIVRSRGALPRAPPFFPTAPLPILVCPRPYPRDSNSFPRDRSRNETSPRWRKRCKEKKEEIVPSSHGSLVNEAIYEMAGYETVRLFERFLLLLLLLQDCNLFIILYRGGREGGLAVGVQLERRGKGAGPYMDLV